MEKDKRKGLPPIPDNLGSILTELQMLALHRIENFGWKLLFVRRQMFQDVMPVVRNVDGTKVGVLELNGNLNLNSGIIVRA